MNSRSPFVYFCSCGTRVSSSFIFNVRKIGAGMIIRGSLSRLLFSAAISSLSGTSAENDAGVFLIVSILSLSLSVYFCEVFVRLFSRWWQLNVGWQVWSGFVLLYEIISFYCLWRWWTSGEVFILIPVLPMAVFSVCVWLKVYSI